MRLYSELVSFVVKEGKDASNQQVAEIGRRLATAEKDLADVREERDKLQKDCEAASSRRDDERAVERDVHARELRVQKEEMDALRTRLDEEHKGKGQLEQEMTECRRAIAQYESQIQNLETKLDQHEAKRKLEEVRFEKEIQVRDVQLALQKQEIQLLQGLVDALEKPRQVKSESPGGVLLEVSLKPSPATSQEP